MGRLLERGEFRRLVLARSKGLCVFCKAPAVDAHHILDRALFSNGGYYLSNGAAVCAKCHYACERTDISVEEVLEAAGIKKQEDWLSDIVTLPCDKWGNPINSDGTREKGPLFYQKGVQMMLQDKIYLFQGRMKYPRTPHLPWSNASSDDKKWDEVLFEPEDQVVVTEKMDGECTSIYSDGNCHARSIDSKDHPSRHWIKAVAPAYGQELPYGWTLVGENCFAKHSISYDDLSSYFYAFALRDDQNFLSWDLVYELCTEVGIELVPILYQGPWSGWNHEFFRLYESRLNRESEGYVVRRTGSFPISEFHLNVAKYVRPNHVQTDEHWMNQSMVVNGLKK